MIVLKCQFLYFNCILQVLINEQGVFVTHLTLPKLLVMEVFQVFPGMIL